MYVVLLHFYISKRRFQRSMTVYQHLHYLYGIRKTKFSYIFKPTYNKNDCTAFATAALRIALKSETLEIPTEELQGSHESSSMHFPLEEVQKKGNLDIFLKNLYSHGPLLQDCIYGKNLAKGKSTHAHMIKTGFEADHFLNTRLVILYGKCGSLEDARQVFDNLSEPCLVSWNTLLAEYSRQGFEEETLKLFRQLGGVDGKADEFSFVSILKACTGLREIRSGKQVHGHIVRSGLVSNSILMTTLGDFYAKCWCLDDACQVFEEISLRDVVSWTAIISGYVRQGNFEKALAYFSEMPQAGIKPNIHTFRSVFKACAGLKALEQGKQTHAQMVINGLNLHLTLGNGLADMYAKCGCLENALLVYEKMPERDVVSFNTMISAYTLQGHGEEAFKLFSQMQQTGIRTDEFTLAGALGACANLASMQQGKQVHACIIKKGFESDVVLKCTLVDTYAKCGSIDEARQVFDLVRQKDVILWTVIVTAYAKHGFGEEVIGLFEEMKRLGMKPDHVTFLGVLTACSHAGLVDEGWHYFHAMTREHCIVPRAGHYSCMVDLLCRSGCLNEAHDFIQKMPIKPTVTVWGALLRACQDHGNTELGKLAAEHLFELDPQNIGCYVVLSNIYANVGKWGDIINMRKTMKDIGTKKEPGCSWIEVKNSVHVFSAGGSSHPQIEEIYAMLQKLAGQMKEAGYVPNTKMKLSDVEEH